MNSLRRMLDILGLVTRERPMLEIDEIREKLGYAQATAYRYVRELTDAGLLVRLPRGYTLGPRVIELDLQMRETDPLLNHGRDLMRNLVDATGLNVLLSELYGETVITTHQEMGSGSETLNFGRGRPMPLFRSATSTIILAHLAPRQLRRIFDRHQASEDVRRLGATWKDFARAMAQLRKQGHARSRGELDSGKAGLAAAIFDDRQRVIGSVSLVGSAHRVDAFKEGYLADAIREAAQTLTRRIVESGPSTLRPDAAAPEDPHLPHTPAEPVPSASTASRTTG